MHGQNHIKIIICKFFKITLAVRILHKVRHYLKFIDTENVFQKFFMFQNYKFIILSADYIKYAYRVSFLRVRERISNI